MSATAGRGADRIGAIDIARGVSLIGMALYHLSWDLADFGLAPASLPYSPSMRIFSHLVGGAFLLLAGVSLGLAHRGRLNWGGFGKRLGLIVAAATLVSVVTTLISPEAPIYFGILHCIAAASLLAAPLLRAPAWAALALGAGALVAPRLLSSPMFDPAPLLWLGLGTREPATLDWRPLLPWAGVTFIGLGLEKLVPRSWFTSALAGRRPRWAAARALAFGGRHSLAVYLIHQPVLFALLYAGTQWTGVAARQQAERYLSTCRPACVEAGGEIEACNKACACVVQRVDGAGLIASLSSRSLSDANRGRVNEIVEACGSEAR